MSNKVQGLVYDSAPFYDARFNVLLALADAANDDGYAYISMIKLARKARVSFRSAINAVKNLESEKINGAMLLKVVRHGRKKMANDYYINIGLLESLPYYWPPKLEERLLRVQPLHPKPVGKGCGKTRSLGATVENLRVQPLHPSHHVMLP